MNDKNRLIYLNGLTPGKRTEEIVNESEDLKEKQLKWATGQLQESHDIEKLSTGLPDHGTIYQTLRDAASTLIPDVPEMVFSHYAELVATISAQASRTLLLANLLAAHLSRVRVVKERAEAQWAQWSPTEEKWRLNHEFTVAASDLIELYNEIETTYQHCIETYKDRQRALEDLRSIYYSFK